MAVRSQSKTLKDAVITGHDARLSRWILGFARSRFTHSSAAEAVHGVHILREDEEQDRDNRHAKTEASAAWTAPSPPMSRSARGCLCKVSGGDWQRTTPLRNPVPQPPPQGLEQQHSFVVHPLERCHFSHMKRDPKKEPPPPFPPSSAPDRGIGVPCASASAATAGVCASGPASRR